MRNVFKTSFIILLIVALCLPVIAQDSLNVTLISHSLNSWSNSFEFKIDIQADYAFVATGSTGLKILDISEPTDPYEIAHFVEHGICRNVDVEGDFAYLAIDNIIKILDISAPNNPVEIGDIDHILELAMIVRVSGDFLYVSDYDIEPEDGSYLQVFDITDRENPVLVNTIEFTLSAIREMHIQNDVLYTNKPFQAFDISNPYNITLLDSLHIENTYYFDISDTIAIAVYDVNNIEVVDISDPSNLELIYQSEDLASGIKAIEIVEEYVYLDGGDELITLCLSDPELPVEIDRLVSGDICKNGITSFNNHLFIAEGEFDENLGISVFSIVDPSSPNRVGRFDSPSHGTDVYVTENLAYVAVEKGLHSFDVADPFQPIHLGHLEDFGDIERVTVSGDYAYLTASYGFDYGALIIISVIDPSAPTFQEYYLIEDDIENAVIHEQYAYIGATDEGVLILNIEDPENPSLVNTINLPSRTKGVAIQDHYLYVCNWHNGLAVFDVSDPESPVFQSIESTGTQHSNIVVDGNYAFIGEEDWDFPIEFLIVDISDPNDPEFVWRSNLGIPVGKIEKIDVSGNFIFVTVGDPVAGNPQELHIYDISNPYNPIETGYFSNNLGWNPMVDAEGSIAYISTNHYLKIFDCTDALTPQTPLTLAMTPWDDPVLIPSNGGSFRFDAMLVNDAEDIFQGVVWTEIIAPNLNTYGPLGWYPLQLTAGQVLEVSPQQIVPGLAPGGQYTYIANIGPNMDTPVASDSFDFWKTGEALGEINTNEWSVLGLDEEVIEQYYTATASIPTEFKIESVYPNPFNPVTSISVSIPEASMLKLSVFNIVGQEVALLEDGCLNHGYYSFEFDGSELASGIYFVQALINPVIPSGRDRDTHCEIRKVVLMK